MPFLEARIGFLKMLGRVTERAQHLATLSLMALELVVVVLGPKVLVPSLLILSLALLAATDSC